MRKAMQVLLENHERSIIKDRAKRDNIAERLDQLRAEVVEMEEELSFLDRRISDSEDTILSARKWLEAQHEE